MAQDLINRDEALVQLKHCLQRAQDHMTHYVNTHWKEVTMKEGDWIHLKIWPHRQGSIPTIQNYLPSIMGLT